jgi:hypothetical protein
MKTKSIHLLFCTILYCLSTKAAVNTFTLFPCTPLPTVTPVNNPNLPPHGCYSYSATLNGVAMPSSHFQWNFDDGTSVIGNGIYHCYTPSVAITAHNYTVTYIGPILCGPNPTQYIDTHTVNATGNLCVGSPLTIVPMQQPNSYGIFNVIPGIYTHLIDFGDGSVPTATNFAHTYTACGSYIVTLQLDLIQSPSLPSCYQFGAVNIPCSFVTALPESKKDEAVKFYPNPCQHEINIEFSDDITALQILDITGRELVSIKEIQNHKASVETRNWPKGVYFLKCTSGKRLVIVKKIIKE